jgi:RimJ/RimL family protein N-acetyltransferase
MVIKEDWALMSEKTHSVIFDEIRPSSVDRVDFAIVAFENNDPVAYMTCYEHDAVTLYLQHGGKMPDKSPSQAFKAYSMMLSRVIELGYYYLKTKIENKNTAMLRVALKAGWRVCGTTTFKDKLFVECSMDIDGGLI